MQARPIQQSIPIRTLASAGPILVPPPFLTVFFAIHKFSFLHRLPIGIVPSGLSREGDGFADHEA